MSLNNHPDQEKSLQTWLSFKTGDWGAYEELYNTHFKILNNYGYKFTRDAKLIEDSVHDLFVELWSKRSRLSDPVSVKNYLYRALRNHIFRKMEKQQRFVPVEDDAQFPFNFEVSLDTRFIENETQKALQAKVQRYVNELPARQQEIIFLRFYEGLDYEEIAEVMGLNKTSAYKLLYKAIDKLQHNVKMSELLMILCLFSLRKGVFEIN